MKKYRVGIIGCGKIFPRHLEAILSNDNFQLVSVCDVQENLAKYIAKTNNVSYYVSYKDMLNNEDINFVVIATPNSFHVEQAEYCIKQSCDVLIEKPVSFKSDDILYLKNLGQQFNQNVYCVLQVRLNSTVKLLKNILDKKILGDIRGINLTQRWQRPLDYFSGWRASPEIGGGTLYEVGIHYIDILQYLVGMPKNVHSTKTYITKHKNQPIEDTIYTILDYNDFGGVIESTIATEPKNLEASITILGSNGTIKLGGKALNIIEYVNFLSEGAKKQYDLIIKSFNESKNANSYGTYEGSCPNHPELYSNLENFKIDQTYNVIKLIENIYSKANIKY